MWDEGWDWVKVFVASKEEVVVFSGISPAERGIDDSMSSMSLCEVIIALGCD